MDIGHRFGQCAILQGPAGCYYGPIEKSIDIPDPSEELTPVQVKQSLPQSGEQSIDVCCSVNEGHMHLCSLLSHLPAGSLA